MHDLQWMEVTYWSFEDASSTRINLFADGSRFPVESGPATFCPSACSRAGMSSRGGLLLLSLVALDAGAGSDFGAIDAFVELQRSPEVTHLCS